MSQQAQAKNEIEVVLIAKANADPTFRQALVKNAKAAIEKEYGVTLPAGTEWKVVEETATTNYLVLPAVLSDELSDRELDAVAGGETKEDKQARDAASLRRALEILVAPVLDMVREGNKQIIKNIR